MDAATTDYIFFAIEQYIVPIISSLFFVFFGIKIISKLLVLIKAALLQTSFDRLLIRFILSLLKIVLYVLLFIFFLDSCGIPVTGIVSAISAVTLAIGLATQNIIAGVASGMMLVTTNPFKVGDFVEVDGISGSVKKVSLFHTILNTPDNKRILVPNRKIFDSRITNYSTNSYRRLDLLFGVDSRMDKDKVLEIIYNIAESNPNVLKEYKVTAKIDSIVENKINYVCRVFTLNKDFYATKFDITEQVLSEFKEKGILLASNQITVNYREKEENV